LNAGSYSLKRATRSLTISGGGDEVAACDIVDGRNSPEAGKLPVEGYGHANQRTREIVDPAMSESMGLDGDVKPAE